VLLFVLYTIPKNKKLQTEAAIRHARVVVLALAGTQIGLIPLTPVET